jgi:hypothetical protein
MLAALLLAAATFSWGLRLLQVRRLLRHLGISKTRSLAAGLVSLEGEVQPAEGQLLIHPDTEEACVYTRARGGAPQHRSLVDESGGAWTARRAALVGGWRARAGRARAPHRHRAAPVTARRRRRSGHDSARGQRSHQPVLARGTGVAAAGHEHARDAHSLRPRRMPFMGRPTAARVAERALMLGPALAATWMLVFLAR